MSIPAWLLWVISLEELALLLVFVWQRSWVDVVYWVGVLVVNVALILRAQ